MNYSNIYSVIITLMENKGKYISVVVFLFVILLVGGIYLLLNKGNKNNQPLQTAAPSDTITANATPKMNTTELQIEDERIGTGEEASAGEKVTVNYVGTLTDGTKFDSSYDRNQPFSFNLGAGEVIPGWDQGINGMKVGGKRKLIIPSSLAYGDGGVPGAIPGGATLIFEVELLGVN